MKGNILQVIFVAATILLHLTPIRAQDTRTQYPAVLRNAYFGVNIGYIDYNFSQQQLEAGYQVQSIHVPHMAVRVILMGYQINKYLSAQISYMRPAGWVEYRNVNGSEASHKVGMNIAGLTAKWDLPLSEKISFNGEAGIGIITRGGFIIDNEVGLKDASYASLLAGAGITYQLNKNWELLASATWSPSNKNYAQPATRFYAAGFNYTMRPLSKEKVERNAQSGYQFPKQLLQLGITTNALGYEPNNFFSRKVPIFWGGDVQIRRGLSAQYQRNIFHGRKVFSLDWGVTLGWWETEKNRDQFWTLAIFPLFRFSVVHTKPFDLYLNYSLAGPAFISKPFIDNKQTGEQFTFQDFMGIGIFAGKKRQLNAEARIMHYSNGNIFPKNEGVKVPLTLGLGYCF